MNSKNKISNLPTPSAGGLSLYLAQIKKFPIKLLGVKKIVNSCQLLKLEEKKL